MCNETVYKNIEQSYSKRHVLLWQSTEIQYFEFMSTKLSVHKYFIDWLICTSCVSIVYFIIMECDASIYTF